MWKNCKKKLQVPCESTRRTVERSIDVDTWYYCKIMLSLRLTLIIFAFLFAGGFGQRVVISPLP